MIRLFRFFIACGFVVALSALKGHGAITIDPSDPDFARLVQAELGAMRSGERGLVSRTLIARLEKAPADTVIRELGPDETSWHPNDRRGTRSHVVAQDIKLRGAGRESPTDAVLHLHQARVDPTLSVFRLGTFAHQLAIAADLNEGSFSGDFRIRERRATFYRNGWLDSLGLKPILVSDRIPTPDYSQAKALGLLTEDRSDAFPILDAEAAEAPSPEPSPAP